MIHRMMIQSKCSSQHHGQNPSSACRQPLHCQGQMPTDWKRKRWDATPTTPADPTIHIMGRAEVRALSLEEIMKCKHKVLCVQEFPAGHMDNGIITRGLRKRRSPTGVSHAELHGQRAITVSKLMFKTERGECNIFLPRKDCYKRKASRRRPFMHQEPTVGLHV